MGNSKVNSNRKSNFELLRIFAMLMIVAFHYAYHGIQKGNIDLISYQGWSTGSIVNKMFTCFLTPGGEIGVALFFMLTGYFMVRRDFFSLKKIVLECIFYGILACGLFIIVKATGHNIPDSESTMLATDFISTLFNPASGGLFWFVSAYILLMLITPFLNRLFNRINYRGMLVFLLFDWFVWYLIPNSIGGTYHLFERAVFFYSLGALCSLHLQQTKHKELNLSLFCLSWTGFAICNYVVASIEANPETPLKIKVLEKAANALGSGLFVVVAALSLFRFFEATKIRGGAAVINAVASTVFGVYLIHDSFIGRPFIWDMLFEVSKRQYQSCWYPLMAAGTILIVFIVCIFVDMIRQKFIQPKALEITDNMIETFQMKFCDNEKG